MASLPEPRKPYGEEKMGRVLLSTGVNQEGKGKLEILPGVKFCNLTLKWYDMEGNIHSLFHKYKGKPFAFGFTLKELDRYHNECEIDVALDMPFAVGEMCHQDVDYLEDEGSAAIEEIKKAYGLTNLQDIQKATQLARVGRGEGHHIFAGVKSQMTRENDDRVQFVLTTCSAIFDDLLEEKVGLKLLPFMETSKIMRHLENILLGDESSFSICDKDITSSAYFTKLEKFIRYARETALKNRTEEEAKYFLEEFCRYLETVAFEISAEGQQYLKYGDTMKPEGLAETSLTDRVLGDFIRVLHGEHPSFEAFVLAKGIKLYEQIRNSFFVKRIVEMGAEHVSKINDILSYSKEFHAGVRSNVVCLYHDKHNMPLKDAMQMAIDKANEITASILETEKLLLAMYDHDEELQKFLCLLKSSVFGHTQWYTFTKRYEHELIYDCIIKL